jgi:transposase-like protein
MNNAEGEPQNLAEAIRYFSDPDVAIEFVAGLRWPDGPVCPRCGGTEHSYLRTRRIWKCRTCDRQFSVKVGTLFEGSPIGLDKWLTAVWMVANSKDEVSSYEIQQTIGVTQKTSWSMMRRIRLAMQTDTFESCLGKAEVDGSFDGGEPVEARPQGDLTHVASFRLSSKPVKRAPQQA